MSFIKKTYLLLLFFCSISIYSQKNKFSVKGVVFDKKEKTALNSATVYFQEIKDSTVVSYTTTDEKGAFSLEGKSKNKQILMFVSFLGYKKYTKKITTSKKTIKLDTIFLSNDENILDEVVIKSRPPITIKKDTVEFNPRSFKTKKDATLEDFLKKLPGVEVDKDGKITIKGIPVDKILVNGKPFFGNDSKIALENLTKDIIDKIQVTDTKTKSEAFTGEVGEKTNKTINISIKKEYNRGAFGRIVAGTGTQNRNTMYASVNFFNNNKTMNVYAGGNNATQKPLSNGLKNTSSGKYIRTNFSTKLYKKNNLNSNYSYNNYSSENGNIIDRENIIPDFHYFSNIVTSSKNESNNHRFNIDNDIKVSKNLFIQINPRFNFSDSNSFSMRDEKSTNDAKELINSSNATNSSSSTSQNFSNNFNITQKFGKNGSFLKLRINSSFSRNKVDNYTLSETNIFGSNPSVLIRNQESNSLSENNSFNTHLNYRLPLIAKELFLNFRYSSANNNNKRVRNTYDFDTATQEYNQFNLDQSNASNSFNRSNTVNVYMTYRKKKWFTSLGSSYIVNSQKNIDNLRSHLNIQKDFKTIDFNSRIRYSPKRNTNASIRYSLRNRNPSLTQLNPFRDISNPLNIITGNPNLKTAKNHRVSASYNTFNSKKKLGFYSSINASFQDNKVVSKTIIQNNFVRNTSYTNVNGNYNIGFYTDVSKRFKFENSQDLRLNLSFSTNFNNSVNYSNDILYNSKNTSLNPSLRLSYSWKDFFEITPRYRISITKTKFNLEKFTDKDFINHTLQIRTRTNFPKRLEWNNTVNYRYNSAITEGFPKSTWTWDARISYSVFKKRGLFSLLASDILNQNNNVNRVATDNFIQYSQRAVNNQNIMLSFRWKFNTKKRK
ncbi:MAG: outer membrane beta-barrel protein [Flavobacteriaceae bacterium]|nr:outer membrane beta-barrel protein [Flavobacteriaceae bacterium]